MGVLGALLLALSAATPGVAAMRAPLAPGGATVPADAPSSATDETKVPHYFGPWPNWANSQLTLPDVAVEITGGGGTGATATATIGANGAVTGLTITDPGSGYTTAPDVAFTTANGTGASATAAINTTGSVTGVTIDMPGSGYTAPTVSFDSGAPAPVPVAVGNPLIDRAYATDYGAIPPALVPVLIIVPTPLPVGTLTSFETWNQATTGGSPTPSAGGLFHAYVLRPSGSDYTVVFDSGELTVPALADSSVSEAASWPFSVPVLAGDVIGYYGSGIPTDLTGSDTVVYPLATAPVMSDVVTPGAAGFPTIASRTYSFGAIVEDATAVPSGTGATGTVYGGVDAVQLADPGSGYTMPTVDFDFPDDPAGTQASGHTMCAATTGPDVACSDAGAASPLVITSVAVDQAGSGYATAPGVVIRDGTAASPILGATPAAATATLKIQSVVMDTFGGGYTSPPTVTIDDPTGTGAMATALTDVGVVSSLTLDSGGSGYLQPGITKFEDALPGLCLPGSPTSDCPLYTAFPDAKYIPLAVPDTTTYPGLGSDGADQYVIGLVQFKTSFSSSLPDTLVRGYAQIETAANAAISQHFPLVNEYLGKDPTPVLINGEQAYAVTPPQWLGPTIGATKDRPVRIEFHNLLPTGVDGNLFLPVDTTMMGSGMGPGSTAMPTNNGTVLDGVRNPMCTTNGPKPIGCYTDNRATLHLHGGTTPWISDGTPHQWITPAGDSTAYPEGVAVQNVPDMDQCKATDDGCSTFYYTNEQSARLMFYHDHAWGITRLNVYAGEAAGYIITDDTEQKLITDGTIPDANATIPLVVQDRTFVPDDAQLALQDPTWDAAAWGTKGSFWYHHVYMPAQNPGDPSGMSAYGRWMYGPWFWPPATPPNGPIANPYYDPNCDLNDPATWTYQTDPFCEPEQIPGTPNISVGMEQFNDTPIVNGVAYPTVTLDPKAYRLRFLNAANDRFFNFQWYVGDDSTASTGTNAAGDTIGATEVALNPTEVAAAQTDINVFPTPVQSAATTGPDWIAIGSEGGFLPAPTVIDGQQPTTWIIDPTRFDVGNVDKHSLLIAPAERSDVIVDFSKYAGQTLILYNDAPAAFPARVASYDYYTGAPDTGARPDHPRLRPEHADRDAGEDRRRGAGASVQPDQAHQRVQAPRRRQRGLRVRAAPDHRRPGRLQLRVRHLLRR